MDVTKACLTVVAPKDHPQYGKSYPIKEKQLLGSGNCAIKIKGTSVELNHLDIQARQGVIMLKNLAPQESTKVLSFFVPQGRTIILMENDVIELGNINNSFDRKRILQPSNRQLLAEWMTEGILHDY